MAVTSKYEPLYQQLRRSGQPIVTMTLAEIETLVGEALPPTARTKRGWWSNRRTSSGQALAWLNAGYHVTTLDLDAGTITFRKPASVYNVQRTGDTVQWDSDLVKALRQHMGLGQSELAEQLGVRQQTISEWETGSYAPKRAMSKYLMIIAEQAGFTYGADQPPVEEIDRGSSGLS